MVSAKEEDPMTPLERIAEIDLEIITLREERRRLDEERIMLSFYGGPDRIKRLIVNLITERRLACEPYDCELSRLYNLLPPAPFYIKAEALQEFMRQVRDKP